MFEAFRKRIFVYIGIVVIVFFILIIQLINLQFVQGEAYSEKSRINKENYIPIEASRGEIYDRNFVFGSKNRVLVSNRPSFNLTSIPARFKSKKEFKETISRLCQLLNLDFNEVLSEISKTPWERFIIKEDVAFDTIVKVASYENLYPNIDIEDVTIRVYNESNSLAHVIGYIGSLNPKEFKRLRLKGYKFYHKMGKNGIEKQYDKELRGIDGYIRIIKDVKNRIGSEDVGKEPISGNNIILTIDYEIQKELYDTLEFHQGTAIVLKPATGEILAMVSKPDFYPNLIISKNNRETIKLYNSDPEKPFVNRAIQAKYPPASTFKLITAITYLEDDRFKKSQHLVYDCPGYYILKGILNQKFPFYCYKAHGRLNLINAIAKSCSVYFYQLGLKVGPTSIINYSVEFGFNSLTGIDLPGEVNGFIPSVKWKRKRFNQSWFDGDTINLSIGQGFLSVTPLENACFVAGIVNNGIINRPYLVKEIRYPNNTKILRKTKSKQIQEIPLIPKTLNIVKQGMRQSVLNGTSIRLKYLKVPVAGKTGTAQTRSKRKSESTQHAWFVGYAPFDGPPAEQVVVAVLIEYGVAGAATAVPVAEKVFAKMVSLGYFSQYK